MALPAGYALISAPQSGATARAIKAAVTKAGGDITTVSYSPILGGYVVPAAVNTAYVAPPAGDPFDSSNRTLTLRELSGTGKTTVTDADFNQAPANDTVVLVRNTTDQTTKLATRIQGTWKYATVA